MEEVKKASAGDVLASANFRVFGTGHGGANVDLSVHAELYVSGAFQYGNQTGMSFEWSNGNVDTYDTRYEKVSAKNFTEYAKSVLEGRVMDTIKVEVME